MKRAIADDRTAPPVEVEHRREAEVDAVRAQLGSEHVAERGRHAAGLQYVAVPQLAEPAHRRQTREPAAEPLHAPAFVVDRNQQWRIAQRVDLGRQPKQLRRRLEVTSEQDHHADQRVHQPLALARRQLETVDADDHRSGRHAPSSASAIA